MPAWKRIILSRRRWPKDLVVPRPDRMPGDAKKLRGLPDWGQHLEFYLYRDARRPIYYFRVWRPEEEPQGDLARDCVLLNPVEAEQLLILQEVSQTLADDAKRWRARNAKGLG